MKKLFLVLLFISLNAFCQDNFRVVYGVQFEGDFLNESQKRNIELGNNLSGIEGFMSKYQFELILVNKRSLYKVIPSLALDEVSISETTAKIFIDYDKQYFSLINDSLVRVNQELYGRIYNVQTPQLYSNWQLKTESKLISGFLCYKAISTIRNVNIEAWYCPEIPVSIGPNEYRGLPGLILEVSRGKLKYLATKIDFGKNITFDFPKGENVSHAEFEKKYNDSNSMFYSR